MYVPRPLPDFISQPWRKIGRRPGIKTTSRTGNGGLGLQDKIWEWPGDEARSAEGLGWQVRAKDKSWWIMQEQFWNSKYNPLYWHNVSVHCQHTKLDNYLSLPGVLAQRTALRVILLTFVVHSLEHTSAEAISTCRYHND